MNHQFYKADTLLFTLEAASEYDTATPYRYAVSRFVDVARLLRLGTPVTIFTRIGQEQQQANLQTVEQLRSWLATHFQGFERYVA